jgi:hypothetical protein
LRERERAAEYETKCTQLVERESGIKYCVKDTALLAFSFPNMTFPSTL